MAMNTALDHVRKMKKTRASSLDEEGSPQPADKIEDRPDRIFYQKELEGKLKEALEKLPADQKATLIFREIEELSYQEIAETMGCSIGTVMSRLHYGRRRLQELLKDVLKKGDEA
jgi:RNA polymerase sigma-70 factor (ECF subfamily)